MRRARRRGHSSSGRQRRGRGAVRPCAAQARKCSASAASAAPRAVRARIVNGAGAEQLARARLGVEMLCQCGERGAAGIRAPDVPVGRSSAYNPSGPNSMVDTRKIAAVTLLLAGLTLVYWQVFQKLVYDWGHDDNYSHGFLIVPICGSIWCGSGAKRLETPGAASHLVRARRLCQRASWCFVAGILGSELFLSRVSLIGVLAGGMLFLYGWAAPRVRSPFRSHSCC